MNRSLEVFVMKGKQFLAFGFWEAMVFMIIASTAPVISGGLLSFPPLPGLQQGISSQFRSFVALDYVYYQFFITVMVMAIFVLKVIVFDFAANLEQGIETSYILLPVKRSRLLVPVYLMGVVLPYALASASVFYALYLVHYSVNINAALSVALLDFLPLLFVSSIALLVAMKSRSSLATLGVIVVAFFLLGIFLGENTLFMANTHSIIPLLLLGLLFPAGSAYVYFTFGYIPPGQNLISTPSGFISVFPWLIAGCVLLNALLVALVFWYWGRKFQIAG